jgi:dTDP-4-amino-4,6-dideoxygalactose transaminase
MSKVLEVFQDGLLTPDNMCELLKSKVAQQCRKKYRIVINNHKPAVLLAFIALKANADSFFLINDQEFGPFLSFLKYQFGFPNHFI